jgi:hypothetical protein
MGSMEIEKETYRLNCTFVIWLAFALPIDFALIWGFVRAYMFLRSL